MTSNHLSNKNQKFIIRWWFIVVGINAFLILASMTRTYFPDVENIRFITSPFNLAVEMNLAVWWSGICLATLGLLSLEIFSLKKDSQKNAWLALSILFMGLSIDEVGSLHERIGNWSQLLPFGIICFALLSYSIYILLKSPDTRKAALIMLAAFFLYGSVVLQEYVEHLFTWTGWAKGLRLGLEEGTELFATFLIFYAIISQRQLKTKSIGAIIPRPHLTKFLPQLIFAGFFVHITLSLTFPQLVEKSTLGNPLAWYPMTMLFILFSAIYWASSFSSEYYRKYLSILALIFLLSSASIMWNLMYFVPVVKNLIPGKIIDFSLYLMSILIIAAFSLHFKNNFSRKTLFALVFALLSLIGSILYYLLHGSLPIDIWTITSASYAFFIFHAIDSFKKTLTANN